MIVLNLKGGLGNQMFQLAAGYTVVLDALYKNRFETQLGIDYSLPFVAMTGKPPGHYKDTIYKNISNARVTQDFLRYNEIRECCYSYIPPSSQLFIDGYFQSFKYFQEYQDQIKKLFHFPFEIQNKIEDALFKLTRERANNVVGIHIRRGDYVTIPKVLPPLPTEYYRECVSKFDKTRDIFIVCTDSPEIVQNEFKEEFETGKFILSNAKSEIEDLCLLSKCDDIIMSNSTFSWWGAFLGNKKGVVYSPKNWFGSEGPKDWSETYLPEWKII